MSRYRQFLNFVYHLLEFTTILPGLFIIHGPFRP